MNCRTKECRTSVPRRSLRDVCLSPNLGWAICLFAWSFAGCETSKSIPDRAPKASSTTLKVIGNLQAKEGRLTLAADGLAPHVLVYVAHKGPWPGGEAGALYKAPKVAALTRDQQGALWLLHARSGAKFSKAEVWNFPGSKGQYLRPGANVARVEGGALKSGEKTLDVAGDRGVFVAYKDGAVLPRILGTAHRNTEGSLQLSDGLPQKKDMLLVRVGNVPEPMEQRDLVVQLGPDCPDKQGPGIQQQFEEALRSANIKRVVLTPLSTQSPKGPALRITAKACKDGKPSQVSVQSLDGGGLLHTPFWSPASVSIPFRSSLHTPTALIAAYRGELQTALWLVSQQHKDAGASEMIISAALAMRADWHTDVPALLGDQDKLWGGVETHLLLAGAQYRLDDLKAAEKHLTKAAEALPTLLTLPEAKEGQQDVATLQDRVILSKAAVLLARGDIPNALKTIDDAATRYKDPRDILLGKAELQIAMGDRDGLAATLQQVQKLSGSASAGQQALQVRYEGTHSLMIDDIKSAVQKYQEAAQLHRKARNWKQVAATLSQLIELLSLLQAPDLETLIEKALSHAAQSFDTDVYSRLTMAQYLRFAEVHAGDAEPSPQGKEQLQQAQLSARQADRLDRLAVIERYSLLGLPPKAELKYRLEIIKRSLAFALSAGERTEVALLLSLRAQFEASAFQHAKGEKSLGHALSFAKALGDKTLIEVLQTELTQLQQQ